MAKKLYFYYSAMNAGKSTTLLQSSYNYIERGMNTVLFAPKIDNRFGGPTIYSRIGLKQSAIGYDKEFNIFEFVKTKQNELKNLACVFVDEAHFLTKAQIAQLLKITIDLNIAVLTYGLRTDFLGEPFEGSLYLLSWAHELVEIKTICFCGKKATMNIRIDENGTPITSGAQVQIGGNESYISACMEHFFKAVPEMDRYVTSSAALKHS